MKVLIGTGLLSNHQRKTHRCTPGFLFFPKRTHERKMMHLCGSSIVIVGQSDPTPLSHQSENFLIFHCQEEHVRKEEEKATYATTRSSRSSLFKKCFLMKVLLFYNIFLLLLRPAFFLHIFFSTSGIFFF